MYFLLLIFSENVIFILILPFVTVFGTVITYTDLVSWHNIGLLFNEIRK